MSEPRCLTCKYCDPQTADQGLCRLEPPKCAAIPNPDGRVGAVSLWPPVFLSKDHCSKYVEQRVKPSKESDLAIAQKNADIRPFLMGVKK